MSLIELQEYLSQFGQVDAATMETLEENAVSVSFDTKDIIFSQGEEQSTNFFMPRGLVRYYMTDAEGQQYTKSLERGPALVVSTRSFHSNEPAPFHCEAMMPITAYRIENNVLHQLHKTNLHFANCYIRLLEHQFIEKERREFSFLTDPPLQRYLNLAEEYAEYFDIIPKRVIASYIGVTPEAVSRIRKRLRLANDNNKIEPQN